MINFSSTGNDCGCLASVRRVAPIAALGLLTLHPVMLLHKEPHLEVEMKPGPPSETWSWVQTTSSGPVSATRG